MLEFRDGRPIGLQGCARLNAWIEAGGSPERPVRFRTLRHRWSGFWSKRCMTLTSRKCKDVALPLDPVFIVGLWRTGSTLLHSALCSGANWTTPRTWQCFHPAEFALLPPPRFRQAVRPMDAGLIHTFSPQEDEFASLLLGEPSTYRAFIDPRRLNELAAMLDEWRTCASSGRPPLSDQWETFIRAVLLANPGPMLLKSPNHTFRLPWLSQRFPNARFIWLKRNADDVLSSNLRMWTAMIERYGQWRLDPASLHGFLRHAIKNHDALLEWARSSLNDRLYVVSFDEVIHRTATTAAAINGFLGMTAEGARALA